jgi:hypothetical protein
MVCDMSEGVLQDVNVGRLVEIVGNSCYCAKKRRSCENYGIGVKIRDVECY